MSHRACGDSRRNPSDLLISQYPDPDRGLGPLVRRGHSTRDMLPVHAQGMVGVLLRQAAATSTTVKTLLRQGLTP
jgi:hypothetical protein